MRRDRDVFEALVRAHAAAVHQTARRIVRSDQDAADVTQQVFLAVLQGRAALSEDSTATEASLRWLAGRYALNQLRASRRRREHEAQAAVQEESRMAEQRQSREAVQDGERSLVRRALGDLHDDVRVPLVLRFQEGLSLAGVASALGCAESTAHSRLQRALEALRARLRELGFAGVVASSEALSLESLVRGAALPVQTPPGLESRLIEQVTAQVARGAAAGAVGGLVAKPLVGVCLALGLALGGGAALAWGLDGGDSSGSTVTRPLASAQPGATAVDARRDASDPESSARSEARREVGLPPTEERGVAGLALPPAILRGRVFDAETRMPLAGVDVSARSDDRRGKLSEHRVEAQSDAAGAFVLELPVDDAEQPEAYRLVTTLGDHVSFRSAKLLAVAGEELPALVCPMRRWATDQPGEWEMAVDVVGPDGAPQQGVVVAIHRHRARDDQPDAHPQECAGRTDAAGRAVLRGTHRGEKMLRVQLFRSPLAPTRRWFRIDSARPGPRRIDLELGGTIGGRIVTAADGRPVPELWITGVHEDGCRVEARSDAEGRYQLQGLPPGLCRLEFSPSLWSPGLWSPFRIDTVPVGGERVIRVKELLDTTDHGDFLAELHADLVDAATGEPVEVLSWHVDTVWIPASALADGSWRATRSAELLAVYGRPRQQAQQAAVLQPQQESGPGEDVVGGLRRERPSAKVRRGFQYDGAALLVVRAPGYATAVAGPFETGPQQMHAGVELRLQRGATLQGVLRGRDGTPVAGAMVWLAAVDASLQPAEREALLEQVRAGDQGEATEADGRFRFEHVPPGVDLVVRAAHADHGSAVSRTMVLRTGEREREIELVLLGD